MSVPFASTTVACSLFRNVRLNNYDGRSRRSACQDFTWSRLVAPSPNFFVKTLSTTMFPCKIPYIIYTVCILQGGGVSIQQPPSQQPPTPTESQPPPITIVRRP
jgi:hypothetical protein